MKYYLIDEDTLKKHNICKYSEATRIIDWASMQKFEQELEDRCVNYDRDDLDMFISEIYCNKSRTEELVNYLIRLRIIKERE